MVGLRVNRERAALRRHAYMIQYSKAHHGKAHHGKAHRAGSCESIVKPNGEASDMAQAALDRETILEAISTWPRDEQAALAREILQRVHEQSGPIVEPPVRRGSLRNLVGLLATDRPPPTDEEVEQWLDEHRMEKYGH
jgi:hypothetical protein